MSKIVKAAVIAVAIIGVGIATGGISVGPSLGALTGGFAIGGIAVETTAFGASLLLAAGTTLLSGIASQLGPKPGTGATGTTSRLSLDPNAPQIIAAGVVALPSQLEYFATTGASNDHATLIMLHAGLPITKFVSLAINNIATPFGPITGAYAGVLDLQLADGTQTANPFTGTNGPWGSTDVGHGIAMSCWNWTYDKTKLASGLPQVLQFVAWGCPVYDPRRDSTRGGSGAMRADDQTTWAFQIGTDGSNLIGRNPALFELTYRLGWKVGGRLKAGMGEDPLNVDMASYIASANTCDEIVNGEPRYRYDAIVPIGPGSTHNTNLAAIYASCGGRTIDTGGLIGLWVAHDDTATATMTLSDDDFVGPIDWEPLPEGQVRNTGRGSYISAPSFYQSTPYPEVAPTDLRALDNGTELVDQLDLGGVLSINQARRIVNIRLRESRQGKFSVPAAMRTLALKPTQIVNITRARFGWVNKPFRVETMGIATDKVSLALSAVQSSDYADLASIAVVAAPILYTTGILGDSSTNVVTDRILASITIGLTATNLLASDAGSNATVTIPAHTRRYSDFDRSISAGTITGLAYTTLYYLYYDDLGRVGGTETFAATTVYQDSLASSSNPGRHYLGSITTPAHGGGSSGGSPPHPGGGGGPIP